MILAALEQIDALGMLYASDGRSAPNLVPYRIAFGQQKSKHVQYPTTLPTFDELIGIDGTDAFGAAQQILTMTQSNPNDQVFTLHAELAGQKLLPSFRKLLLVWLEPGRAPVPIWVLHFSLSASGSTVTIYTLQFSDRSMSNSI